LAFIIINSMACFYILWIKYLFMGKLTVRVFYILFIRNELILFILLIIMLFVVYLVTNYKINLFSLAQNNPVILNSAKTLKSYLPIITFIVTLGGTYLVFRNYLLCMDEYAPEFQAAIFLSGKLRAVVPQPWQAFAHSLLPIHTTYNPILHSWYQGYLPVYAAIKTLFLSLGVPSATNPVLAALSVMFIGLAATNIWPQEKNAPFLAMILLISSSQFLITSMTGYSMPAHLLLNLMWIYCYTHKQKHVGLLLPIIGVIALGVHNPFVHGLFVGPFLLRILRERPWKFSLYVGFGYLFGSLLWLSYWRFVSPIQSLSSGNNNAAIFSLPGSLQFVLIQPMNLLLTLSWQSLAITLLAFFAIRNWRELAPLHRDLFWGFFLSFGFYFFFPLDQGHGWGYRYIYGVLGNLILLAMVGWYELREAIGAEKAVNFLIVTLAFALFIQFPIRCVQAESFVRPFASAMRYLQGRPEPFILLDDTKIWYSQDFIRNDPFLRSQPKVFFSRKLSDDQIEQLNKLGKVHIVQPEELVRFGLIRMETPKTGTDQGNGAGP
jgi:hypothetical protein